ncbi:hypothetical protein WJX84_009092 [Apatococcus fuscideae]|uniref:O-methyltransferase C-terminal domain-containing protein n=1 Tax=Apatococcus fuscideae TaxID=2026836 RepID=A0AAW1S948_9CHLO
METFRPVRLVVGACLAFALLPLKLFMYLVQALGSGSPSEEDLMQSAPEPGNLPWFAINIGVALGRFVELLPNWINPPTIQMLQLGALAHWKASTIKALAELGVADLLARGPRMSILLRTDHPNSVRPMLMHLGNDSDLPWMKLAEGVKLGKLPFELAWGKDVWQYLKEHPEREHIFSQAMAVQDKVAYSTALKEYDWTKYDEAIDIGGAYGSFVAALMRRHPGMQGTVFELPQVVNNAKSVWAEEHTDLAGRISFAGGDFFDAQTLPRPANGSTVYIMRSILHDWDDSASIRILQSLGAVMKGSRAKLVLVEQVLKDDFVNDISMRHGFDLHMLVACGGKERTELEWRNLLGRAGFHLNKIYPTKAMQSMLEAELVPQARTRRCEGFVASRFAYISGHA